MHFRFTFDQVSMHVRFTFDQVSMHVRFTFDQVSMHVRFISNRDSHDLYFDELPFGLRRTMLIVLFMLIEAYFISMPYFALYQTNM